MDSLLPHLRVLEERPLVPFAVYLCLGIASCTVLPLWIAVGLVVTTAMAVVIILLYRKKRSIAFTAMLLAFVAGYTLAAAAMPFWAGDPWAPAGPVKLTGRIVEASTTTGGYDGYILENVTLDGSAVQGRVTLTVLRGNRKGRPGDSLSADAAELSRPQPSQYYGGFNLRGWYLRRGVRFTGFVPVADVSMAERQPSLLDLPERARQYARDVLSRYLQPENAALVNALLSGDTGGIDGQTRRAFLDLGVAHLLAVSGLNISLTAGAAWLLCRKLRLPMPVSLAISFLVMASYVLFAGMTPSVLRAAAMWLAGMGALVFARRYDPLSSLAASAILILAVNPLDLFDAGFQLSFAATAAMFLWVAPMMRHLPDRKWMKSFAGALGVTVCVTMVALPVILCYFNNISLISPLANLILVPASFVMQLAGMALLFAGVLPDAAALLGGILDGYTSLYLHNVRILSWSAATLPAATPPVWLSAVFLALVLFSSPSIARFLKGGRGRVAVFAALLLAGALMLSPLSAPLTWRTGEAVVAEGRTSLSVTWCVEGRRYAACAARIDGMAGYLASRGVGRLDGLYVLAADPPVDVEWFDPLRLVAIKRLYVPDRWLGDPGAQPFLARARLMGMDVLPAEGGPFRCVAGGETPVLLLPAGGELAAYAPDAASAIDAASSISGAGVVLLARPPGKLADELAEIPFKALVLPGEIAAPSIPRYNILEAGSLEIEHRDGALALIPWIGGWADGIQGNFR